nr:hypothetical protein [uncultured Dongia sp.]
MTNQSKPMRRSRVRQIVAGLLVVAGFAAAAASPALAKGKHHNGHDNGNHYGHYKHQDEVRYYGGPRVIYVEPEPIYVRERVYVQPAPVYYQPAPVIYQRPSVNIIVPLFD